MAWSLLHLSSPARVHALLVRLGACFTPLETPRQAQCLARRLSAHGTCLSRSLTIAARMPIADVVIGVQPRTGAHLLAHAWVEVAGVPLDASQPAGEVIARLCGSRSVGGASIP
jgi:hypothetical protein